jgi:hypothetical protein
MTSEAKIPAHIIAQYGSAHAFRAEKRRQVDAVLRRLSDAMCGCAFLPGGSGRLRAADDVIKEQRRDMQVWRWGP